MNFAHIFFIGLQATELRKNRMDSLMSTVNEMSKAMESFVVSMVANESTQEEDNFEDDPLKNNLSSNEETNNNRIIKT